jgi:hypothetical protein
MKQELDNDSIEALVTYRIQRAFVQVIIELIIEGS